MTCFVNCPRAIIGDYNINIVPYTSESLVSEYLNLLTGQSILVAFNIPTHGRIFVDYYVEDSTKSLLLSHLIFDN